MICIADRQFIIIILLPIMIQTISNNLHYYMRLIQIVSFLFVKTENILFVIGRLYHTFEFML